MKILAAVVTHNRCELLKRCIRGLKRQVRMADEILVIDNGSTDGTADLLRQEQVAVFRQPNLGAASGWQRAINYCLEKGYDAVWLMDDDGFPDEAALGLLEDHMTDEVVCASSIVLREDTPDSFVFPFPVLNQARMPKPFGRKIQKLDELTVLSRNGTYDFAHFFNGALISARAIQKVGNVEAKFVMFGDEVDYFFRLRGVGQVLSVLDARHYHPDVTARPYSDQKIYYYIRNSIIIQRRYMDYPTLRNAFVIPAILARVAARNGIRSAGLLAFGGNRGLLFRALSDGVKGRLHS